MLHGGAGGVRQNSPVDVLNINDSQDKTMLHITQTIADWCHHLVVVIFFSEGGLRWLAREEKSNNISSSVDLVLLCVTCDRISITDK